MSGEAGAAATPLTHERAEASYRELLALDLSAASIVVCLASVRGKTGAPTFQTLQLTRQLAEHFHSLVTALQRNLTDEPRTLRSYEAGTKPDTHEIEYLAAAEHDDLAEQVEPLASIGDLPIFEREAGFAANLRFYVIAVQRPERNPIYFFRWYSPKQELSRSRHIAAWFHQDRYDLIREDVLLFDREIDCVLYDGVMFILSKGPFERIFRFYELIRERAETTLVAVQTRFAARMASRGFDTFAEACRRDPRKLRKLNEIAQKPYLDTIDMAAVTRVVARHPHLAAMVVKDGTTETFAFDGDESWLVLRLLDDAYVEATMTRIAYEANSKRTLGT